MRKGRRYIKIEDKDDIDNHENRKCCYWESSRLLICIYKGLMIESSRSLRRGWYHDKGRALVRVSGLEDRIAE